MAALFSPRLLSASVTEMRFALDLSVEQPYLDHHRPGGQPLLSTAMGLEAIVSAARLLSWNSAMPTISAVQVLMPYLANGHGPHTPEVGIRRSQSSPLQAFDCILSSKGVAGVTSDHLRVHIEFAPNDSPRSTDPMMLMDTPALPRTAETVSAPDVYQAFFHGPAFQVIGAAVCRDSKVVCRLSKGLIPSHWNTPNVSELAPRLLEFALQSAGLLELASSGQIMIPDSIARIDRLLPIDVDYPGDITSKAQFGTSQKPGIDIRIFDDRGRTAMAVYQYRTKSLPFPIDELAVSCLREKMCGPPLTKSQ